jgi:hypothetical protein
MPDDTVTSGEDGNLVQDASGKLFLKLVQDDAIDVIERLRETHADVQGRAYLIHLDYLIRQLGRKWEAKRDLVFNHLKTSFERKFQEPNWCIAVNDDSFLAVILTLGEHKGALSAAELWLGAGQFFVGDVSAVNPPLFEAIADDVDRMRLTPIDPNTYFDRAEARPLQSAAAPLPTADPEPLPKQANSVGTMTAGHNRSAVGVILTVGGHNLRVASAIEPVFEMKKLAMIGHRFEAVVTEANTNYQMDARALANLDWTDREQIDLANIEQGVKLLQMRSPDQRRMVMVVPAAFSTFASAKARSRIVPIVTAAARQMGLKVLFEIRHLNGVPPGRITEVASLLKPHCMTAMGHATAEPRAIAALKGCGLAGACLDFERGKRDDSELGLYLSSLSSAARASTGACMIQGFNSLKEMALARMAGVSHASIKASALMTSRS